MLPPSPSPPPDAAVAVPQDAGPLPPCPDTPNCTQADRTYPLAPGALFTAVQHALAEMRPIELVVDPASHRVEAVFRVLIFKDDVAVAVTPSATGSTLYVRSASRTGHHDLGVNRRRVRRFFDALEENM